MPARRTNDYKHYADTYPDMLDRFEANGYVILGPYDKTRARSIRTSFYRYRASLYDAIYGWEDAQAIELHNTAISCVMYITKGIDVKSNPINEKMGIDRERYYIELLPDPLKEGLRQFDKLIAQD